MKERLNFRKFLGMVAPPIIYEIILAGGAALTMLIALRSAWWGLLQNTDQLSFLATALGAAISIPIFKHMLERDELYHPVDYRYGKVEKIKYVYIIFLGFLMAGGVNRLIALSGLDLIFNGYEEAAGVLYSVNIWAELLVLGIIGPVAEEMVFRGVVYERMKRCFSTRTAAVLCSLFFGFYHGNVTQGIYAFLLGLLLIYVKERYHTMAAPMLFHISANIFSVLSTETSWLDWTAESLALFAAVMVVEFAVSVVIIWRVEEEVLPEKIKKDREWHNNSENYRENY